MKKTVFFVFLMLLSCSIIFSQEALSPTERMIRDYIPVEDPLVQEKLEKWKDLKFGLFMHWGTYSQWGTIESWSLCGEDQDFITENRPMDKYPDYNEYKKAYRNLQHTFNPVSFNPEKWVRAAKDAGMKYMVFTTKHHDGFCMFDTRETDYKITSLDCPFHTHPKADITKAVFNAFRDEGFMIGAYFSKPDWDSEYYWWPYLPTPDRHVNYDPLRYPERWERFKIFTHNQIDELMSGYGPVDILWLDGGQVNPIIRNLDIDMPEIARKSREKQPGLIIVDRAVKGPNTNYLTPEQYVPDEMIDLPWESCITMGNSWSYKPGDDYKSSREIIHLLVNVVAKGGNLLLNIGPDSMGEFDLIAYSRLKEIGSWMAINGKAIYGSKTLEPYASGNCCFTRGANGEKYIIYLLDQGNSIPSEITIPELHITKDETMQMLGQTEKLKWKQTSAAIKVELPKKLRAAIENQPAFVISIQKANSQ